MKIFFLLVLFVLAVAQVMLLKADEGGALAARVNGTPISQFRLERYFTEYLNTQNRPLATGAIEPNAALVFLDFMMSRRGDSTSTQSRPAYTVAERRRPESRLPSPKTWPVPSAMRRVAPSSPTSISTSPSRMV